MQSKFKRVYLPKIRTVAVLFICAAVVFFVTKVALWSMRIMKETGITPSFALRLVFDDGAPLKETDNRTNVLVLGVAGGGHAGADLTDTIMVLSFNNIA